MDDHQISELLENLEAWGEEFRTNQHAATRTILRARKTIMDQAAKIAQMNKPAMPRCDGCGGMMLSENWTWCANCGHLRQREDLTPESDKKATDIIGFYSCATVPADFARKMERERNALRTAIMEALMHLETNYDIDGASMKDSDTARILRDAISSNEG